MNFELNNVSFRNKGDELMVYAAISALRHRLPKASFSVPLRSATAKQRDATGLKQTAVYYSVRRRYLARAIKLLGNSVPTMILGWLGLVADSDVACILDVSGFSYGDQWGSKKAQIMATRCIEWKKQKRKIILLPKTFGPFEDKETRLYTSHIIDLADLVFARDAISYSHLKTLGVSLEHVHVAPDYTGFVPGRVPDYGTRFKNRASIIPNYRMIDKTSSEIREQYPEYLHKCFLALEKCGLKPFFLIHQVSLDKRLAVDVQERLGRPVEIVEEEDPLKVKGLIGQCSLVVSSRLHGLINALSQAVPVLATSWNHKYRTLLDDYNCPELLVEPNESLATLENKIAQINSPAKRAELIERLERAKGEIKLLNEQMWDVVFRRLKD